MANKVKSESKAGLLFTKLLEYIEVYGNDQLAAFRGELKRLASLTSIPNIALKRYICLLKLMTFCSRIMSLEL